MGAECLLFYALSSSRRKGRATGDVQPESFRARFGDAIADFIVGAVLKPLCDLIDFLFGEAGE